MGDEAFELQLGDAGGRGGAYLDAVLRVAGRSRMPRTNGRKFSGSRLGRGAVAARMLSLRDGSAAARTRRVLVRMQMVRVGRLGRLLAHQTYLQRDGVARDGGHGRLYSALEDDPDGRVFAERCQGDRHQFRFVVLAKDAAEYDNLQPLIRRFMARMEEDLGTGLDWVAVNHLDTWSPHTHVVLRGIDDHGGNLIISPNYIMRGMKERVAEIVSLDLGPRTDLDMMRGLLLDVHAERLTAIDLKLLREMDATRIVSALGSDMIEHAARTGRLRKLETLGLAENLEHGRWRLGEELERMLRDIGERTAIFERAAELLEAGARIGAETGKNFIELQAGMRIRGIVGRPLDLVSGRFVPIENDRDFALAPLEPVLERALGREVSGLVGRRANITWTFARERGIEL